MAIFRIQAIVSATLAISTIDIFITGNAIAQSQDYGKICTVRDPTGTPLNLRQKPNGKIIARLKNGEEVGTLQSIADRQGKVWIQISVGDSESVRGYVLRKYLACPKR